MMGTIVLDRFPPGTTTVLTGHRFFTTLEMTVNHNQLLQFPKPDIVLQSKSSQKKNDKKLAGGLSLRD